MKFKGENSEKFEANFSEKSIYQRYDLNNIID